MCERYKAEIIVIMIEHAQYHKNELKIVTRWRICIRSRAMTLRPRSAFLLGL